MEQRHEMTFCRRDLVCLIVANVSAVAASRSPLAAAPVVADAEHESLGPRYRESEHVKTYYSVNRW